MEKTAMKLWSILARIIFVASLLLIGGQQYTFASKSQSPRVTWSPMVIEITAFPGTSKSLTVGLKTNTELSDVSIFIVPEISRFLSTGPFSPLTMPSGISYNLPVVVDLPASVQIGTFEGTIHLRSGQRTIPDTLKVVLNVIAPSHDEIPSVVANPSSDRIIVDEEGQKLLKDEIIVGLDFDTPNPSEVISSIAASTGGVILGSVPETLSYQLQFKVPDLAALESIRSLLEGFKYVAFASRHFFSDSIESLPDDTKYDEDEDDNLAEHWDVNNPAGTNWNWELIDAPAAWDIHTGSRDISVAVIDEKFYIEHEDLNNNIVFSESVSPSSEGHGTHVSGIICAEGNNGLGVAGMSWECSLRLYDFNSGPAGNGTFKTQELMAKAAKDKSRIVNMSLGFVGTNTCTAGTSKTLREVKEINAVLGQAILYAQKKNLDVLWIFAAGNECRDVKYQSPASLTYNFPLNTMAVAAVDKNAELSKRSNFGDLVTVAAPGVDILSTWRRSCIPFTSWRCKDVYEKKSGTSMAAPHVAGLASLVLSKHPDFSASKVKKCILSAAQKSGKSVPGHNFKVINAPEALKCEGLVDLPSKVDIVFSIDLTGSMGEEIARIKQEIGRIIDELSTRVSPATDFRFGVVSYEDYPGYFDSTHCGSSYPGTYYGLEGTKPGGDAPFRIDQPLTNDFDAVKATVMALVQGYGADGPESYGRVFWELGQADTGASLGFRKDALKLVVNFSDNVPHDEDLSKDLEDPPFSRFDTGIDPGRNGVIDCGGDDIDFQDDALAALSSKRIRLLEIDSSGVSDFYPYWQFWTSQTGGAFAAINPDGSIPGGLDLSDVIIDLLELMPK